MQFQLRYCLKVIFHKHLINCCQRIYIKLSVGYGSRPVHYVWPPDINHSISRSLKVAVGYAALMALLNQSSLPLKGVLAKLRLKPTRYDVSKKIRNTE